MIFNLIVFIVLQYLRGNSTDSDTIVDSTMFLEDE